MRNVEKLGKRIFALLCACMMVLALASCGERRETVSDTAQGTAAHPDAQETKLDFEKAGVSFTMPASWNVPELFISGSGEELDEGVTIAYVQMYAYSSDEIGELQTKYADDYDAYVEKLLEQKYDMFTVFGIDGGRGEPELQDIAEGVAEGKFTLKRLGEADGWTFFSMTEAAKLPVPPEEKKDCVKKALADIPAALASMRFYEPVPAPSAEIGSVVSFETFDLNGEPVTSEGLFGGSDITMIYLWTSWCGICARELPELEALNESFAEKNCQIVGILLDGDNDDAIASGLDTVADAGVTYPVLKPFEGVDEALPSQEYPTAYFVDAEGRVLAEPIIGVNMEQYEIVLDNLLKQRN